MNNWKRALALESLAKEAEQYGGSFTEDVDSETEIQIQTVRRPPRPAPILPEA